MDEDEFLKRLVAIHNPGDAEVWHSEADALVAEALKGLGWAKFADQYQQLCREEFWYA